MIKLLLLPMVFLPKRFRKYRMASVYVCLVVVILEFIFLLVLIYYLKNHPNLALKDALKNWTGMVNG